MRPSISRRRRVAVLALTPVVVSAIAAAPAAAKNRAPECVEGVQWTKSTPAFVSTSTFTNINGGSKASVNTFTTSKEETVELEASASLEVEGSAGFGVFSASVKAQVGVSAKKSETVAKGTSTEVTSPAKRRTVIRFGVAVRRLKGVYLVDRATLGLPAPTFAVPGLPAGCTLRGYQNVSATVPVGQAVKVKNYKLKKKR